MGRQATDVGGGDFEDPPHGNHLGRCYRLVDLGTQPAGEWKGQPTLPRNQIFVAFELPKTLMKDGRPFTIGAFWTNSLNKKATLRTVLQTWRNKQFTDDELKGFDLEKIVGVPGIVTVGVKPEGTRTTVLGVGPLMEGMVCPPLVNERFTFWIDEWDQPKFDSLSEKMKEMIRQSSEYKARFGKRREAQDDGPRVTEDHDSDIPF